ncbi:armadillo repeat-containing protein 2-like [Anneissia japonica]|uniref:armadillo repeat-containing protein 2-like n=1 Tax=Anneissia japonica TaxID=1529436 RepID=UPI00142574E0|nr:armadillo repeat-containing protein 2-like [Anneissia japonica]
MISTSKGGRPKKKPVERPFYEKQTDKETSSDIINQARVSLRSVVTERPFTPQTNERRLFPRGGSASGKTTERPPSAFSLDSAHFVGSDSRPNSGSSRPPSGSGRPPSGSARLLPLNHVPKISPSQAEILEVSPPKLPKPPGERQLSAKTKSRLKLLNSEVPILPQPLERRNSSPTTPTKSPAGSRRVHSGPKERTKNFYEERGEGEGAEQATRVLSAEGRINQSRSQRSNSCSSARSESGYSSDRTTRSGSGSRKEKESPKESLFWNTNIHPIVEQLVPQSKDVAEIDRMCELCDQLFIALLDANMLGKTAVRRSQTLKTVYKLIDLGSATLSLKAARIVLAFEVTGSNLITLCKLIFKISKNKDNDALFQENKILELMVKLIATTDHQKASEALVYCIGALKFLTGNNTVLKDLADYGCTEALARLLININTAIMDGSHTGQGVPNLLLQVTGTLRNLADKSATRATFISCQIIAELCKVIDAFPTDGDLMFNISRIFSKLTLNQECCTILTNHPTTFSSFLMLMNKHLTNIELIVRLCFIMGNLTARNDDCRYCLFSTENAMETLLSVFRTYFELDIVNQRSEEKVKGSPKKSTEMTKGQKYEDLFIKLIRVIANLSINQDIGPLIASNPNCVDLLLQILVDELMVTLLDSGNREIVYTACGVLINLMTDSVRRPILKSEGGIRKLIDVSHDFGRHDWQLAGMVCMILCNYSEKITCCAECFGEEETVDLIELLEDYLDEETPQEAPDGTDWDADTIEVMKSYWRTEFYPVATQLLNRIENHNSDLVPLVAPS